MACFELACSARDRKAAFASTNIHSSVNENECSTGVGWQKVTITSTRCLLYTAGQGLLSSDLAQGALVLRSQPEGLWRHCLPACAPPLPEACHLGQCLMEGKSPSNLQPVRSALSCSLAGHMHPHRVHHLHRQHSGPQCLSNHILPLFQTVLLAHARACHDVSCILRPPCIGDLVGLTV